MTRVTADDADRDDPLGSDDEGGVLGTPRPAHRVGDRARVRAAVRQRLFGDGPDGVPRIGRFAVLRRIGGGAMGVVYAAQDEELDRRVAIKVVREGLPEHRDRMRREAQMMAKLSHPRIVQIYEVGTHDDDVFIAMELVAGSTLRAWLERHEPVWPQVLDLYRRAGEGLAAAHGAGIVHRDFKPDNVLLGDDGSVKVADFGLARPGSLGKESTTVDPADGDPSLTRTGSLVGTPAFMAPEQFLGEAVDARTDQFAFCVALYEGLYRQHPFDARSVTTLAASVTAGKRADPPAGAKIPQWLHEVVVQGLARQPQDRHASMQALLAALDRDPARRRRWLILGTSAILLGAGGFATPRVLEHRARARCERIASEGIETAFDDTTRDELQAALASAGPAYATTMADRVVVPLSEHASAWRDAREHVCLAARVTRQLDEETERRALWCLDDRREELAGLVAELSRAEPHGVERAFEAASGLSSPRSCTDPALLARTPTPPQEHRDRIARVRGKLWRARALSRLGRYAPARQLARVGLAEAEDLAWAPLTAAARAVVGSTLDGDGDFAAAEIELEAAFFDASRAGAAELASEVAGSLAYTVGFSEMRVADGVRWSRLGELAAAGLPDPDGIREAGRRIDLGLIRYAGGELGEAARELEAALTIREAAFGPDHPAVARAVDLLGVVRVAQAAPDDAIALHQRALSIREAALGPGHPHVAVTLNHLATAHQRKGEFDEARRLLERSVALSEAAFGVEHPQVAGAMFNLGAVLIDLGDREAALEVLERSLAIRRRVLRPGHADIGESLTMLGSAYAYLGDSTRACELQREALHVVERALGPDHPRVASVAGNLGLAMVDAGDAHGALVPLRRALAVREQVFGPDHPAVGQSLHNLSNAQLAIHDYDGAIEGLERALAIADAVDPVHPRVGHAAQSLAVAKREKGDRDEAEALHRRALQIWTTALGPDHPTTAFALSGLADLMLDGGRPAEALELAQHVVEIRRKAGVSAALRASASLQVARAQWELGVSRLDALAAGREAAEVFTAAGPGFSEDREAAEAWVRAHE